MPAQTLITFFFSVIHSNISNLLEVYSSASKSILRRFETLLKRTLKVIFKFNLPHLYPTKYNLTWQSMPVATFAQKIINGS